MSLCDGVCPCGAEQCFFNGYNIYKGSKTMNKIFQIDAKSCSACGQCTEICQAQAIDYPPKTGKGYQSPVIDPLKCRGCGLCAKDCPADAIK